MVSVRSWIFANTLWLIMQGTALAAGIADESAAPAARDDLIVELRIQKHRVFVNETVTLSVVLLADSVAVRNIRYPILETSLHRPPEFGPPRKLNISRNARNYDAHEFVATVTPSSPGKFQFGPAEITCDVAAPLGSASAFFGTGQPHVVKLRSEPATLTVLPLPTSGRPMEFSGAVGRFAVSRTVTPAQVRQGEPFTVTTRIRGTGNVDTFSCETIKLAGIRSYPPRPIRTPDSLTCEQTLIADKSDLTIPAARIAYFDPSPGRYVRQSAGTATIQVQADDDLDRPRANSPRTPPRGVSSGYSGWSGLAWVVGFGSVVFTALAAVILRNRCKRNLRITHQAVHVVRPSGQDYLGQARAALAGNDPEAFYLAVFRSLQTIMAKCLSLPPEGLTADAARSRTCTPSLNEASIEVVLDMFRECDAVRYGLIVPGEWEMAGMLERLRTLSSDLAKRAA